MSQDEASIQNKHGSNSALGGASSIVSSRRQFLAATGAATVASFSGCLGGPTSGGGNGDTPEPPWTTETLADQINDSKTVTIYAGTGDSQQWHDLVDVINDEFGTSLKADVFASDGSAVSQRFLQERRANEDKADAVSTVSNLTDEISSKGEADGTEQALEWFEGDIDQNFWFADVLPDERVMSFQVSSYNGGAGICMPVSEEIFESQGLDYPTTYNDLFDDQYEGLDMAFSGYVSPEQIGWIARYHAEQRDMEPMEWAESLMERFNVVGVDSHSAGTREVGRGNAALMLYNWPWSAAPFVQNDDLAVRGVLTDPVKANGMEGPMLINKNAPNPWGARFLVSAMLEKPVQRRMLTDVTDQVPVRTDLDLSGLDIPEFTKNRLNAQLVRIGYWEGSKYATTGQEIVDSGIFSP